MFIKCYIPPLRLFFGKMMSRKLKIFFRKNSYIWLLCKWSTNRHGLCIIRFQKVVSKSLNLDDCLFQICCMYTVLLFCQLQNNKEILYWLAQEEGNEFNKTGNLLFWPLMSLWSRHFDCRTEIWKKIIFSLLVTFVEHLLARKT